MARSPRGGAPPWALAGMLLLLACCCAAPAWASRGRGLLGGCPAGCAPDGCLPNGSGGKKCVQCLNRLVTQKDTCACPVGTYAGDDTCLDCEKGSYCLGGAYVARGNPGMTACPNGLTTAGRRAFSPKSCVNPPGYVFAVSATGVPSAVPCPANTFSPGIHKQRACVPCANGFTTRGHTHQWSVTQCVVPEGYYTEGPGKVAPCERGAYKAGFNTTAACTPCPAGSTTAGRAATSASACSILLPGFYAASLSGAALQAVYPCPQGFVCSGGVPSAAFDVSAPSATAGTTVSACPDGTRTQAPGATSAAFCLTPPGHKTVDGVTTACGDGEFRAEWRPAAEASACSVCGKGIGSNATQEITLFALTPDATPRLLPVRGSEESCYIAAGQGMYYSSVRGTYWALNCNNNSYGVANVTWGLSASPCSDCPAGMRAELPASAAYFASDGGSPPRQGFTSPLACMTQAGHGSDGRSPSACPQGSWSAAGDSTCTRCGYGLSTQDDPAFQTSAADCKLAPGFGWHNKTIVACPLGTFNSVLRSDTATPCDECPDGLTTQDTGAISDSACNLCAPGRGGSDGATCPDACGGAEASYGPPGRVAGTPCLPCPTSTVGFSFTYNGSIDSFVPAVLARPGAAVATDCLAEFAQIINAGWEMGGSANLSLVEDAATLADCVASCRANAACLYLTYDYSVGSCYVKLMDTLGSDLLALKAVPGGDVSAKAKRTKAKALASGTYTWWRTDTAGIGADASTPGDASSVADCLQSCDALSDCAGAVMRGAGLLGAESVPDSCSLVTGDASPGNPRRSLVKVVTGRLDMPSECPLCTPANTLTCSTTACVCEPGFDGPACEQDNRCSDPGWCHDRGVACKAGVCTCNEDWSGPRCTIGTCAHCSPAHTLACSASNVCTCAEGWEGADCMTDKRCDLPDYCHGHASSCTAGVCTCQDGWWGERCESAAMVASPPPTEASPAPTPTETSPAPARAPQLAGLCTVDIHLTDPATSNPLGLADVAVYNEAGAPAALIIAMSSYYPTLPPSNCIDNNERASVDVK